MKRTSSLACGERGAALIEFAIVAPLLLFLMFAGLEFSRYLLVNIKVQTAAYAMANIITQYPPATSAHASKEITFNELTVTLGGAQLTRMLAPFGSDAKEGMIVTSVTKNSAKNPAPPYTVVQWQVFSAGSIGGVQSMVNQKSAGAIRNYSSFVPHQPTLFDATKYPGFSNSNLAGMLEGENMIVVEVFYHYKPLYQALFGSLGSNFSSLNFSGLSEQIVTRQVVMVPRIGALPCLPGAPGNVFVNATDCPGV